MRYRYIGAFVLANPSLLVLGCCADSQDANVKQGDWHGPGATPPVATRMYDPDAGPECVAGDTRAGTELDFAPECECTEDGFWDCFGVTPERQIGGDATCRNELRSGQEVPCSITVSECDDNRTYSIMCNPVCVCVVNAIVVGELRVGMGCVHSIEAANAACSWNLKMRED